MDDVYETIINAHKILKEQDLDSDTEEFGSLKEKKKYWVPKNLSNKPDISDPRKDLSGPKTQKLLENTPKKTVPYMIKDHKPDEPFSDKRPTTVLDKPRRVTESTVKDPLPVQENIDQNINSNDEMTDEIREELYDDMKTWLEYDDDIKLANEVLKTIKNKKKDLTGKLLDSMDKYKITDMSMGDNKIIYETTSRKETLKKDTIRQKLLDYLNDPDMADNISEYLENSRGKNFSSKIKRKAPPKSKKDKKTITPVIDLNEMMGKYYNN